MADHNGRPFTRSEDRTTRYRLYPVKGEPTTGDTVVVNADGDLEFSASSSGDALVDDTSGEVLVDDTGGDVLYDG